MRIFIYSRKSKWTGRGESVENQIAMCREYIFSNIEGADKAEIAEFEDEGFSGKNTKRPEFQRMMARIEKKECDYLVCYKLDRLGRNIADLANLIETLNRRNVAFISIRERFDTSTPIGKAMLYFAGVLAQMEREQIAERVRDNMIMLARRGRWLGGNAPLGFQAEAEETLTISGKRKRAFRLTVNEEEMKIIRFIFGAYLEKQSLTGIMEYFMQHDIRTKRGNEYTITTIRDILTNPVYCTADKEGYDYFRRLGSQVCMDEEEADGKYGLIAYAKTSSSQYKSRDNAPEKWIIARGKHRGIITGYDFMKVQRLLDENRKKGDAWRRPQNTTALLAGILYCSCGSAMRPKLYAPSQLTDAGERRFSYRCVRKDMSHGKKCAAANVQGNKLDKLVCGEVLGYADKISSVYDILEKTGNLMDETRNEKTDTGDLLNQEIQKRKKEIRNLISALARSEGNEAFVSQIESNIVKLNEECAALEKERKEPDGDGAGQQGGRVENGFSPERLPSFKTRFEMLNILEKREYLRMVLDKVIWNGEEAHIFICGGR